MSKKLYVAPHMGEEAWLLVMWQGYIRNKAKEYDEVIIAGRPGRDYYFKDYCTEYINYNIQGNTDCAYCNGQLYNAFFDSKVTKNDTYIKVFPVRNYTSDPNSEFWDFWSQQEFVKLGKYQEEESYDLVIHARSTNKYGTGYRNWDIKNWQKVADHFNGLKIATIGSSDSSVYINGTINKLNLNIENSANLLKSSKLLIGTSSFPIHLAAFCETKHIVITIPSAIERYRIWNPFNTPYSLIHEYKWNPPINVVIQEIEKNL